MRLRSEGLSLVVGLGRVRNFVAGRGSTATKDIHKARMSFTILLAQAETFFLYFFLFCSDAIIVKDYMRYSRHPVAGRYIFYTYIKG
jgi:hypothetical protein